MTSEFIYFATGNLFCKTYLTIQTMTALNTLKENLRQYVLDFLQVIPSFLLVFGGSVTRFFKHTLCKVKRISWRN